LAEGPGPWFGAVLFTDIQESTPLWERYPDRMPEALSRHHRIIEQSVTAVGGTVIKNIGDGFVAAFPDAATAVSAAVQAQMALSDTSWDLDGDVVSVRMAVDCGEIEVRDHDVGGPVVNRCARLMDVAHGGQILVSDDAVDRLDGAGVTLTDLGSFSLKGIAEPVGAHRVELEKDVASSRLGESLEPGGIGWAVRGFELRERIGAGMAGVVYRAHQRSVGREVAIKLIRPEFANDRRFVHRFESEAQFIARLEHPHIVSLYDYWRDPDGAYLVMRWLRGGSLRQALERGPWHEQSTIRLLQQIGSALAYAHRRGVIHRDVRPSNILLDEEGNGYLSDFGIASRPLAEGGGSVSTSSEYRSPEEIAGRPLTEATDQFCLAMVAHELLTGRRPSVPFRFDLDEGVASALAQAIRRASAEDPADRFPSVEAFLASVGPTLDLGAVETDVSRNPFKGLRPFFEADAVDFFGRDELVNRLVRAVASNRLVTVVGASGSGKSSAVRAGLVPALRRGAVAGSERWFVADLYPGAHPFDELASALLSIATRPMPNLVAELTGDTRALGRIVKQLAPSDAELVLVLDQFEELFTRASAADRAAFLDAITDLVSDSHARARVVVTLRADFYDRPLAFSEFARLIEPGLVSVPAPTRDELTAAIREPSQAVGLSVDPALAELILAEVVDQPGALPLLQYTLTELFDARTGSRLTTDLFTVVGGVRGSLSRRAEVIFGSLDPAARTACEQIFLRLVSVEEDAEDTRRRITRASLDDLGIDAGSIEAVLDAYGRHRLVTFDHDPSTRDPTVELAHEALLRGWSRLAGWIDERRQDLITEHHLAAAVSEWEQSGRDPDHLLSGSRLARYEDWSQQTGIKPTDSERVHLTEARRHQNERAARRHRVRRLLTAGFAVIAVIATAFAVYAIVQQRRAEREERVAVARELAAAATANLAQEPELSILLALEAIEATRESDGLVLREAEEALHEAIVTNRVVWSMPVGPWTGVTWTPGGKLAITTEEGPGRVVDPWNGDSELALPPGVTAARFSPAGSLLALGYAQDHRIDLFEWDSMQPAGTLEGHTEQVIDLEFTPDGTQLVSVAFDGTARIWNLQTLREEAQVEHLCGPAFGCRLMSDIDIDPSGRYLGIAALGPLIVYDMGGGQALDVMYEMAASPVGVAFLPDGEHVAVGAAIDGTTHLFEIQSGEEVARLADHKGSVGVELAPDGSTLLTGATDRVVVYSVDGSVLTKRQVVPAASGRLEVSPDGRWMATSDATTVDGTLKVFDIGPLGGVEVGAFETGDWPAGIALSHDGLLVAFGHPEGGVVVAEPTGSGAERHLPDPVSGGWTPAVSTVAFSPDARLIAAGGESYQLGAEEAATYGAEAGDNVGWVRVWEIESGEVQFDPFPPQRGVYPSQVSFSADGSRLAVTGAGDAVVFDTANWTEVFRASEHSGFTDFSGVGLSPDGALVATQAFGQPADLTVEVWEIADSTLLWAVPDSLNMTGTALFDATGERLLTSGYNEPSVWAGQTGELLFTADGNLQARRSAWSPTGDLVAAAGRDGTVRLWDGTTGEERLILRGHSSEVWDVSFDGSGQLLATIEANRIARVWTLDLDQLIGIANERLTRDFTDDECRTYLHVEQCPRG
jgi:serine/threonine protein kinase/WD40 repeat protein/class 3 adenylate cyclase